MTVNRDNWPAYTIALAMVGLLLFVAFRAGELVADQQTVLKEQQTAAQRAEERAQRAEERAADVRAQIEQAVEDIRVELATEPESVGETARRVEQALVEALDRLDEILEILGEP